MSHVEIRGSKKVRLKLLQGTLSQSREGKKNFALLELFQRNFERACMFTYT